jgi:signal-transduction protein with cAMP-binding, CBS, and nucleotidyltransferase domain
MVTKEDLKQIVILTYLTDPMLDNLTQIIDILKFDKDEILFRENDPAERFYMIKSGNVLLEQRKMRLQLSLDPSNPGFLSAGQQ